VSSETLHVTASQIEAAKLLIRMLEADGEHVDDDLRAIAAAQPVSPIEPVASRTTAVEVAPPRFQSVTWPTREHRWSTAAFRLSFPEVASAELRSGELELVELPSAERRFLPEKSLILEISTPGGSDLVSVQVTPEGEQLERSDLVDELVAAVQGTMPIEKLSDEAKERLIIIDKDTPEARIVGLSMRTPEARAAHRYVLRSQAAVPAERRGPDIGI
jgi:hypothetical protein